MAGVVRRGLMGFGLLALASSMVALLPTPAVSQQARFNTASLTYLTGQSVVPVFHGWSENADGTFDLHFSYLNRNWQEEVNIPVGPDNNIQPAPFGPDGGQPTHFYPRMNRWQFTVRVPADFGKKEIVWALTSHGETIRTYASLDPGYAIDDYLMQFENGGNHVRGRKKPNLAVDGARERSVKVGEASPLSIVATDNAPPPAPRASGNADEGGGDRAAQGRGRGAARGAGAANAGRGNAAIGDGSPPEGGRPGEVGPGIVGGEIVRSTARGLWLAVSVYRGAGVVKLDPPMRFKVWEDQRGGSPWAPGWQPPPIPPGNKWLYNVTFQEPGEYVMRILAHNGSTFSIQDVKFAVTR